MSWIGYKFLADVNDYGLTVSVAMTSTSARDSEVRPTANEDERLQSNLSL